MSTICKLEPQVRHDRKARAGVVRYVNSNAFRSRAVRSRTAMTMQALANRTHRASHLTGTEKNRLFEFISGVLAQARL